MYLVSDYPNGIYAAQCSETTVKKGRHRRFEEARKLKQAGPSAADLGFGESPRDNTQDDNNDEYAAIAERYGVRFDDDDDESEDELD